MDYRSLNNNCLIPGNIPLRLVLGLSWELWLQRTIVCPLCRKFDNMDKVSKNEAECV